MKIAAFYSDSPFAGWVQCEGFVDVLRRMGHDVVPIPVPPGNKFTKAQVGRINKPIDDCELVIVSGPEWLKKWITTFYPHWSSLKMPKVGWYHESFVREDMTLNYADYESMFDFHFFPDKSDAEKYRGEWLPLGVDTGMFHVEPTVNLHESFSIPSGRDIDVAFIGLMYPKRARFVEELRPHLGDIKLDMRTGFQSEHGLIPAIACYDFNGLNIRKSMELLAETYRRIKVFVTFPSLSNVLVAKVLESMACGCALVAPKQTSLDHGYCHEYSSAYECAQAIRSALVCPIVSDHYAQDFHRMELRFEQIFTKVGLCTLSS